MRYWNTRSDPELIRLHSEGWTIEALKAHFGVGTSTLYRHLNRLGLSRGQPGKRDVDVEEVAERLMLNQSVQQIADELGCGREAAYRAGRETGQVYRNNLKRRGYGNRRKGDRHVR